MENSRPLVLKTSDINPSIVFNDYFNVITDNSVGSIRNSRQQYTWKQVDFRRVVGDDMYNKYNIFNIALVCAISSASATSTAMTLDSRTFAVKLSGIPFVSSYSHATRGDIGECVIATTQFSNTASTVNVFNSASTENKISFRKFEHGDITIKLHIIQTDTFYFPTDNTQILGQTNWSFIINPVE
jgi:hypothetical protein